MPWVRPRFSVLTQIAAVVFIIAGLGAGYAVLTAGHQTTPGHDYDRIILFALALGFVAEGAGLFLESVWAWWSGVAIAAITVVAGRSLGHEYGALIPWALVLCLLAASAVQGMRVAPKPL
jgi:hypothetical protein